MRLPWKKIGRALPFAASALAISAVAGCFTLGVGLDPPLDTFYYPTAVVVSPGRHTLYVANSDFDIQYTGGTVQALDLDAIRTCVGLIGDGLAEGNDAGTICRDVICRRNGLPITPRIDGQCNEDDLETDPEHPTRTAVSFLNEQPTLVPGPCAPIRLVAPADGGPNVVACYDPTKAGDTPKEKATVTGKDGKIIQASRIIGAFASDATLGVGPGTAGSAEARLFVTVRGDPSVTYFDTTNDAANPASDPFRLDCKSDADAVCPDLARVGASATQSVRLIDLPIEPTGIAATEDGLAIVVVHQTGGSNSAAGGQVSLISNPWTDRPQLEFTLGGLPDNPTGIAAIPSPAYVTALRAAGQIVDYRPEMLVTFRSAREVDMVRYYDDTAGTSRHFLQRVAAFGIATNSDGLDSRGIAILDADRKACEGACDATDLACLKACAEVPLQVFVANRAPASLVMGLLETQISEDAAGKVTGVFESLSMNDMIPLATGPSRVAVGNVLDGDGKPSPRVFVVSFDSRYVVIYDPAQHRVEAAVRTGRGPHAMAFDVAPDDGSQKGRALLYVAHFTDSYIGVVDLDTRNGRTYGSMFAAIGAPTPPKESN